MDYTTLMTPAFIVPVALGLIGFIVWLVRLEGKNSTQAKAIERIEKDIERLKLEIEAHRSNGDIHFNRRLAEEVDKRNEHRFNTIEAGIQDIGRKLNHLSGRE